MSDLRTNHDEQRYERWVDGDLAALTEYRSHDGDGDAAGSRVLDFVHTETRDGFTGRGLAGEVVRFALDDVRRHGWLLRPLCPYVQKVVAEHAEEYRDLVPREEWERFDLA